MNKHFDAKFTVHRMSTMGLVYKLLIWHWTPQQRQEAAALFQDFILCNRLPPKRTIETAIRQSTHLKSRTWRMVRQHLRFHHIKKSLRQEEDEDI